MSLSTVQLLLFGVVAAIVTYPLLVVLHEACHVAGGRLVGLRPRLVRVGRVGPVKFRVMVGSVEWRFHQKFWTGGDTLTVGRKGRSRWAWIATTASGPVGGVLIAVALWGSSGNLAVRAFALANVYYSYANCFGKGSDGEAIMKMLRSAWRPSAALLEPTVHD
jgi:hypothetical protein